MSKKIETTKPMLVREFIVKVPKNKAWELLSNMEEMGLCIPGCKEVKKISDTEYDWVIQAKVLHTSRTITARTRATEIIPPTHVTFLGEGELQERFVRYKMTLSGTTTLQSVSENETKVTFAGSVNASGMGGAVINKIASGQMKGLLRDFEQNIRAKLENVR